MSTDENVFRTLTDMGIDSVLARAAAQRFTHVEPAINWCFGDGANWDPSQDQAVAVAKPTQARPVPPTPDFAKAGTTVEHHEVASHTSEHSARSPSSLKSPPLPARPQRLPRSPEPEPPQPITFGDKNPFRNTTTTTTPLNPFYQSKPPVQAASQEEDEDSSEDEDEALQRALAMSVDPSMEVDPPSYDDGRADRERSIRATAPPPSPTEKRGQLIGPINQESRAQSPSPAGQREEGNGNSLALMPSSMTERAPSRSKEDEDIEKAIADSLMTASFHSNASAPRNLNEPIQKPREVDFPMILYSETRQASATAHLLQALIAIPRIQVMLESLHIAAGPDTIICQMWEIIMRRKVTRDSFAPVDDVAQEIHGKLSNNNELPPGKRILDAWHTIIAEAVHYSESADPALREQIGLDDLPSPQQLFHNKLSHLKNSPSYVTFRREDETSNIHTGMVHALWSMGSSCSIHETSDIMFVMLQWGMGKREPWKLEQKIVIDRYMTKNVPWALNLRAETGVSQGKARRLGEKLNRLTIYNGHSIEASMKSVIKYYETTPAKDEMQQEQRAEMKEKLEKTLAQLQGKIAETNEEIKGEMFTAHGGLFKTDDPEYNQHVYRLVAVLYHDGALMGQGHLYMYLLGADDQWWKIQDHEATRVDWSAVASDTTGMYMDGGPYCLVYDRESPRPEPYGSELERQGLKDTMQVDEQPTPRPPARHEHQGVALHSSDGQAEHIEHLYPHTREAATTLADLMGDGIPRPLSHAPVPRPLPPVPNLPPPTATTAVPKKEEADEDVTMS